MLLSVSVPLSVSLSLSPLLSLSLYFGVTVTATANFSTSNGQVQWNKVWGRHKVQSRQPHPLRSPKFQNKNHAIVSGWVGVKEGAGAL